MADVNEPLDLMANVYWTALIVALEKFFGRVQIFGSEPTLAKYCQKKWQSERADHAVVEMVRNRGRRLSTYGPIRSPVYRRGKQSPHSNRPVRVPSRSWRRGLSRSSGQRNIALSHPLAPRHHRRRGRTIVSSRQSSAKQHTVPHSRIEVESIFVKAALGGKSGADMTENKDVDGFGAALLDWDDRLQEYRGRLRSNGVAFHVHEIRIGRGG